jgi:SAM-dependent methyltransferase
MKYYEAHEIAYKKLLSQGRDSWDDGPYDDFEMRPYVEQCLTEIEFPIKKARCLELGCGTGPLSCMLAELGANVTGIDISVLAIQKANEISEARSLHIDFKVGDLCRDHLPSAEYDLIIDNHFLHCIIYPDERIRVLQNIRQSLKPNGQFWTETMVGHPEMKPPEDWNMDDNGVTWAPTGGKIETNQNEERNGKTWMPIRLIQPNGDAMEAELKEAHFNIQWSQTIIPQKNNDTADFQARCCPR